MRCDCCPLAPYDDVCPISESEYGIIHKDGGLGCRHPKNWIDKRDNDYCTYLGNMGTDMGIEMSLTDSELIKALENKVHGSDYACFEDYEILDLINRQKAEIEKLKGSTIVSNIMESQRIKREAKAEAYKEFATKIYQAFAVENTRDGYLDCTPNYTRLMECVDDVLKELVGDNK